MRGILSASFTSRPTPSVSSGWASTRSPTRSRSWPIWACSSGSMPSGSGPTSSSIPIASARRSGASRAAPMPDMNTRSSQSIAGVFRAPSTTPCARGSASRAFTPAIGWGGFAQEEGAAPAYFFDRNASHRATARGDILIGADGIHSAVREALYPNEGPARWNGSMLWRGAIDWPQFLTGRSMVIAGGMAAKLVFYPVAEGSRPNHRLTNWAVLVKIAEPGEAPRKEDWSRLGRLEELMPHVQRFRIPYVDAKALIEASPEFWEYPLCDSDPLPRWSHGRVPLLW